MEALYVTESQRKNLIACLNNKPQPVSKPQRIFRIPPSEIFFH